MQPSTRSGSVPSRRPSWRASLTCVLALGCLAVALPAQNKSKTPKAKPQHHAVIQVGEQVKVVLKSNLKSSKLEVDQEFKRALRQHEAAKKQAKKVKQKFTEPKPKKAKFKVLKNNCKTKADAEKFVAAHQKKAEAKARKSKPRKSKPKTGKDKK